MAFFCERMTMKVYAKTKDISEEDWLNLRTSGIGGSDVASIVGLNPYQSIFQVWMEKTGSMLPEQKTNDVLHFGHVLEPVIRQEFTDRTGYKVQIRNAIFQHPEHDFMLANVDGIIRDEDGLAIFEAKTASAFKAKQWEDGVPWEYILQVHHYMAVLDAKKAFVACLIGGNNFVYHVVERDEDLVDLLVRLEKDFWENYVQTNHPPQVDGSSATCLYLSNKYKESKDTTMELPAECAGTITEYHHINDSLTDLKYRKEELANQLKDILKSCEKGYINDQCVSWKRIEKNNFDAKTFQNEHPSLYKKYLKTSEYRRFQVA